MNRIARFFEALHNSRQREADRVIRRYRHLIEEANEYERKREIKAAGAIAEPASPRPFTAGEQLCSPQT
jgi:hypothetical protein